MKKVPEDMELRGEVSRFFFERDYGIKKIEEAIPNL